jgi:hypothetical protein
MPYNGMTPKQKRIIERDIETLFSPRAFIPKITIEDIKRLGPFLPSVKYKNRTIFLSETGVAALRRLKELINNLPILAGSVSKQDINNQVFRSYSNWLESELQPTGQEFTEEAVDSLLGLVKHYEFLIQVEGIDLKDQDVLELGSIRIQESDRALLQDVNFKGNLDIESIYEQFKDSLWLIGSGRGSTNALSERLEYRAFLTTGIIAVYGAILYKGAFRQTRVCAITSPFEHSKAVSSLMWEIGGKNPWVSRKFGTDQDLPIDSDSVTYLTEVCFLKQLASLPDRTDRSELQESILNSIYWFADAYRDRIPTMQFLKLWTCAECFFSIKNEGFTELNAKGIAVILTFGGYNIVEVCDYAAFKKRIKHLYRLRSKALHRAKFGHIRIQDLDDFSRWIAWVIISMVTLAEQGYKTLHQVHEQISRLDGQHATLTPDKET